MAVATPDVGSFAFIFHDNCVGQRLKDGITQLKAALAQAVDSWDPFSEESAHRADVVQAKADRLRDLLHAAEKKDQGQVLQAYRPYELTDAYVGQLGQDLESARAAVTAALHNWASIGVDCVNSFRHQKALAGARAVWAEAARTFDKLLQKALVAHKDMMAKANSICQMGHRAHTEGEMKLATLRLQTANRAYDNDAKAFEDHVLWLTAADDAVQALQSDNASSAGAATSSSTGFISAGATASFNVASATRSLTATAASARGFSAPALQQPASVALAQWSPSVDEDEDETGLETYGGVAPGYGMQYGGQRPYDNGSRYGYISVSAGNTDSGASGSGFSTSSSTTGPPGTSGSLLTVASGTRTTTTTTQRALDRDGYVIFEVVNVQVSERLTAVQVASWQQQWGQAYNNGLELVNVVPAVHPKEPSIILHIGLLREEVTCGQIRLLLAHLGYPRIQWIKRGFSTRNGPREDCAWAKFITLDEAIQCKYRWDAISDWGLTPDDTRMGWPRDLHFSFATRPGCRGRRT